MTIVIREYYVLSLKYNHWRSQKIPVCFENLRASNSSRSLTLVSRAPFHEIPRAVGRILHYILIIKMIIMFYVHLSSTRAVYWFEELIWRWYHNVDMILTLNLKPFWVVPGVVTQKISFVATVGLSLSLHYWVRNICSLRTALRLMQKSITPIIFGTHGQKRWEEVFLTKVHLTEYAPALLPWCSLLSAPMLWVLP